ncbi:MAG: EVE domain-containing protein [Rudaea sp.]
MSERRYWIGVVPEDHAAQAVADRFVQLQYGRRAPLARMQPGDGLAFYSPRVSDPHGAARRAFTAIGRVDDGQVFEVPPPPPAPVYRRSATYLEASPAPITPLLDHLSFIRNKAHWGAAFRFGVLRVPREDFLAIAAAMGRNAADFA